MKTLKTFYFQLKLENKNTQKLVDYCYNFRLKTKHITNYIELNCLKSLKYKTEEFQGIGIDFMHGYDDTKWSNYNNARITPSKSVGIFLRFDKERYDTLKTDDEFREFIYEYMVDAFEKIETKYQIPSSEMLASYNELKEKNFVNERLITKKTDRTRKLLTELHCAVTIEKYVLSLKVFRDKQEVYNQVILETVPDEYAYANKVKKLVIEQDEIKVLGTGDKLTFSLHVKNFR